MEVKVCIFCNKEKDADKFTSKKGFKCQVCKNKNYYEKHKVERAMLYKLRRKKLNLKRGRPVKVYHVEEAPIFYFDEKNMKITKVYCTTFGCGRELSLVEKLAGEKCLKCQPPIRQYGYY